MEIDQEFRRETIRLFGTYGHCGRFWNIVIYFQDVCGNNTKKNWLVQIKLENFMIGPKMHIFIIFKMASKPTAIIYNDLPN
jgi:hypothetical protein